MSVLNSELEEAAVGTMMPVVTPDQVLAKNTAESVDKEFGALRLFSGDDFEEGVLDNLSLTIENFISVEKKRKANLEYKEYISIFNKYISIFEKYMIENDKNFIKFSSLKRSVRKLTKDEAEKITKTKINDKYPIKKIYAVIFSTTSADPVLHAVCIERENTEEIGYGISSKFEKFKIYYVDCCNIRYFRVPNANKSYWEKTISDITDKREPNFESEFESAEDILYNNGLDSVVYEDSKIEERVDYFSDDEFFGEAAKIDDDIKDIIKKLNDKGYETLYSCSGHPSARLKSDGKRDGIKDKKLYSTAKIVFAKDYNFPSYPDGWEEKKLDEGNIGIYVKGPTFRIINGLPVDQFYNWKKKYMHHLEKWVDELPDKDDIGKEEKSDEITESMDEILQDLMIDLA